MTTLSLGPKGHPMDIRDEQTGEYRRRASDSLDDAPWYFRFLKFMVQTFGIDKIVTVSLIGLLAWLAYNGKKDEQDNQVKTILALQMIAESHTQMLETQRSIVSLLQNHSTSTGKTGEMLFALCINSAKDSESRMRCNNFFRE